MGIRIGAAIIAVLILAPLALADRDILADQYLDKLQGMWLGEILGNYADRPTEGVYGQGYSRGNPASSIDWNTFIHTTPWDGDDDTGFEYLNQSVLLSHPNPTSADIQTAWETHVPLPSYYIANRQARWLMADGVAVPQTGSITRNMHWYAIDSQITTESLGAAAPGMRQRAADLAGLFGGVSNDGYALHAAQFYAAMYAAGAVETDIERVVAQGQDVVPRSSRTYQIIQDVRDWYEADKADGVLDWRATHELLYNKYVGAQSQGRYRNWIESSVNTGLTTLSLLYGQGDFKQTVTIGAMGGFDSDCNPATAGGLIGMMRGYSGLPSDLTSQAGDAYKLGTMVNFNPNTTVSQIAAGWQTVAEAQILASGGTITGSGAGRTYHLPTQDAVLPPPEKFDPVGPKGLVGLVRAAGGTVRPTASVEYRNINSDRYNLDAITDGITDVSYNGHLPYISDDSVTIQPAGGDYYQLNFDRKMGFNAVVFYEGDIVWTGINNNPKTTTPAGGYFTDLTVEVVNGGSVRTVSNLHLSEPLDPFKYFQTIVLSFDPVAGDAIRIRGTAGGTQQFTSIVELEAYGRVLIPGDANGDSLVDVGDLGILGANYRQGGNKRWETADFTGDGTVDVADLGILGAHYGQADNGSLTAALPAGATIPEPATLWLLLSGLARVPRSRRL